jgi:hypothetical protein
MPFFSLEGSIDDVFGYDRVDHQAAWSHYFDCTMLSSFGEIKKGDKFAGIGVTSVSDASFIILRFYRNADDKEPAFLMRSYMTLVPL